MLSESNILILQELFWQPGKHHLQVKTFSEGRKIVSTFLNALNYYKNIACLTTEKRSLPKNSINISAYFEHLPSLTLREQEDYIESFFLERNELDFLWIEMRPEYQSKEWFQLFQEKLYQFKIRETVPILITISITEK